MKKMRFKRGLACGALAMAFAFCSPFWAGCGEKDNKDTSPSSQTETTETIVKTDKEVATTMMAQAKAKQQLILKPIPQEMNIVQFLLL